MERCRDARSPHRTTRQTSPGASTGGAGRLLAACLVVALSVAATVPAWAYSVRASADRPIELRSPWRDATDDERNILLAWTPDLGASEYVVFVSTASLAGRSAEDLLADPSVVKATTAGSSIPLRDVTGSPEGTTAYSWAVAARDRESGALVLSEPSSFRSVRTYQGGTPESPLIQEVARGRVAPEAYDDAASILLGSGLRFDPIRDGEPQAATRLTATPLREGEMGSYIVQITGPVGAGQREALAATGAAVIAYVPNYAFLVRMGDDAKAAVAALPFVRWVGTYHPAYKISVQREMLEPSGARKLVVLLFPDADLDAETQGVAALGGSVLEATNSGINKVVLVSIDMARVADLVARNGVAWVEPWHEMVLENTSSQWIVQTNSSNNRRVWDMGIHGEGQIVMTCDSGIRTSHNMFSDPAVPITAFGDFPTHRKIIAYQKSHESTTGIVFGDDAGAAYHGTHTAGTIVGDDSFVAGAALQDGMALKAKIYFMDGGAAANTISAPQDLNIMFQPAYTGNLAGGARVTSNSWGGDNLGVYDVQQMSIDQFTWNHKDFLVFFSNGNAGGAGTVGTPAGNKNGIGAGGTNNPTATSIYTSTSRGPTADGRRKPTICAPANPLSSASGANDTGFQNLSGTSMSSPAMAGAALLLRQYMTDGWYPTGAAVPANAITPSAALLKAMAIASTDNDMTSFTIPDNNVGWGRINDDNVLYFSGDARRLALIDDGNGVATGEFVEYEINVTDGAQALKMALCWTDKEGNPASATQLVNNLDLLVTEPNGTTVYKGNVFSAGQSTTGGTADVLNVEEGARRTAPATGIWKVRVIGTNVPYSPQPFALVLSGGMGQNNGIVRLDGGTYGQSDVIGIRVEDLNAGSPITVNVSSNTETSPEPLLIAGTNGVFVGSISTTAFAAAKNGGESAVFSNGVLSVTHGDTIKVAYTDASPAATVQAKAIADFTGPVITNVSASDGEDEAVEISWTTDILSDSRVFYGLTPGLGSSSALDPVTVTGHTVVVSGLLPDTTYYFDVESADRGGNATRDDLGGAHYRFTTGHRADVLLVIGDNSFTLDSLYTTALDNLGWDYAIHRNAAATPPRCGDKTSGMRAYKAVWWQTGYEQYPPFSNASRDSFAKLHDGGARISVVSHDVAWAFSDAASGYYSIPRKTWLNNYTHITWQADPTTWSSNVGIAADPISGAYTGGTPYTPFRDGGAGDEINGNPGTGTQSFVWRNNDGTPDDIAARWTSAGAMGSADSAVWGGAATQLVYNGLEWAQFTNASARQDILDKTLIWLIGRDHPDVTVTAPAPASVVVSSPASISWTEATYGGTIVASRRIDYSSDGGASWNLVTTSPGTSPYSWTVAGLPNGAEYLVRVVVTDNGTPAMVGGGTPDPAGKFTINLPGGDTRGPVVVAGSITSGPNPQNNANASTLASTVTDVSQGGSNIDAAEWSVGAAPYAAGSGFAMSGAFGSQTVAVSATVPALVVGAGAQKFWVRAHDTAGNWGPATAQSIVVNGAATGVDGAGGLPGRFALEQNSPNPFNPTTAIRYALPKSTDVELSVFNASGQKVRTLVSGVQAAGFQTARWDGRNDRGETVTSGVYLYKLKSEGFEQTKKMTLVK